MLVWIPKKNPLCLSVILSVGWSARIKTHLQSSGGLSLQKEERCFYLPEIHLPACLPPLPLLAGKTPVLEKKNSKSELKSKSQQHIHQYSSGQTLTVSLVEDYSCSVNTHSRDVLAAPDWTDYLWKKLFKSGALRSGSCFRFIFLKFPLLV